MSFVQSFYDRPITSAYTSYLVDEYDHVSLKDFSFLAAASKIAATSDYRFRMAALVVKSGRVLSGDVNIPKISPSTPPERVTTHAEIRALKNSSTTKGVTIYVARLDKLDRPTMAKPCGWCMQVMLESSVHRVVYTTKDVSAKSFCLSSVRWKD